MPPFDVSTTVNWIISGFIGLIFGIISAWITYRYARKRDDISWEREKGKLQQQFKHDKEILELQSQKRIQELEQQLSQQQSSQLKEKLTEGLDNPDSAIKNLQRAEVQLKRGTLIMVSPEHLIALAALMSQVINQLQQLSTLWSGAKDVASPQMIGMLVNAQTYLQQVAQGIMVADQE